MIHEVAGDILLSKPLIVQHLGDLQIPIYLYCSIRSRYLQPFLLEDLQ